MPTLLRHKFNQKYLIHDYETEGLNLGSSRPFQLSWGLYEGNQLLSEHDFYIKWPDLRVSPDAARITGFSKAHYLKNAVDPYFVFQEFWPILNDSDTLILGHNILNFDVFMTGVFRSNLDLEPDYGFVNNMIDTRAIFIALTQGIKPPEDGNLVEWQYKILNMRQRGVKSSLSYMLKYLSIDYDPSKLHNSLYDIKKNAEAFFKLIHMVEI